MAYPSKPWTNGQIATGIVEGETYIYDAAQGTWVHQTKATLDSDYQVDKTAIEADIASNVSAIAAVNARVDVDSDRATTIESAAATLTARVDVLDLLSDSEAERVQRNIDDINTALSMLDSDGIALQAIRTDFEAADATLQSNINAANGDVTALRADLDSDVAALQASISDNSDLDAVTISDHDSDIANLSIPVVSSTQPAGQAGLLWINTNDGKLYYWNGVDAFVTIATV